MTLRSLSRLRLINQQLAATNIKSAPEMVQWFGAMQAQEYAQTKWALRLRLPRLSDPEVEDDFTKGKILRTHLLRPTWHFVSEKDIGWLLALTAPRVQMANAYMYRKLELDVKVFNKCCEILTKVLRGGKELTRDRINAEFRKSQIVATGHRLSYIMMDAELKGIICSGARQGNRFTYALLEDRVRDKSTISQEEALPELALRYFQSRGPATIKDFSTWSGLTITDCKRGVAMVERKLEKAVIDGHDYYFPGSNDSGDKQVDKIFLLPIYDEFIMGYKDRSAFFERRQSGKTLSRLHYDNMIMRDGQIIGTWGRTVSPKSMQITTQFFDKITDEDKKLFAAAVNDVQTFTGLTVDYTIQGS